MSAHHEMKNKTPKSESKPIIKGLTVGAGWRGAKGEIIIFLARKSVLKKLKILDIGL